MKRSSQLIIGLIVIVIIAVGGYAVLHKSNNNKSSSTNKNTTSNNVPSVNNSVVITKTDAKLGKYLADPKGMPLYTYNSDTNGVSNCSGSCLTNWPPYTATGSTANLPAGIGTIKRSDTGQTQYTYNGMPLYYFSRDSVGKVTGDGIENFSLAIPAAASASTSTSTSTNSSSTSVQSNSSSSASSGYSY